MRSRKQEIVGLLLVATLPLVSFPLSWLPQQVAHDRFIVTLPIAAVVFVGLLLVSARWALRSEPPSALFYGTTGSIPPSLRKVSISTAIFWPSILLLLSWLVSVRYSQRPYISISILPALLSNFAVFLLATRFPVDAWRKLFWVWLIAAALVAINGIVRIRTETEVVSTIGNRNFLGAYLAASIALGAALWDKRATAVCALLLAAMCLCRSRGAWLALGATALLWFFWGNSGQPTARVLWRVVGMALVIAAVFLGRGYVAREWRTEVRPLIWKSTLRMIAEHPFLGHGLGTFVAEYPQFRLPDYFLRSRAANVTDHAHNEVLEIAAEQGLLGLVATLWLWGAIFYGGMRSLPAWSERRRLGLGILGAATVLLLHGMLDVGLRYPPNQTLFWFLLGLLAGGSGLTEDARVRAGMLSANSEVTVRFRSWFTRMIIAAVCIFSSVWITIASVVRPVMTELWERRARMAEERGELAEAVADAQRSLEFQPFHPTVRYLLAGVLEKIGARDQAIEQCLRIEELSPDYADVTYNLGRLHLAQGQAQQALPYLGRAAQINPYNVDRQIALASAYAQLGQTNSARTHLEDALHLDPQNAAARNLLTALEQKKSP
ncbi:MAG: O-antigen ligase family protein [Verrucomicrobiia bacterium]|jgi:tetratricopeptide (TPR) repeat protein